MTNNKSKVGILLYYYYLCKGQLGLKITYQIGLQMASTIKSIRFDGTFFRLSKQRFLNYGGKRVNWMSFINEGNINPMPVKLVFTT